MARTKKNWGVGAFALAVAIGVSACSDSTMVGGPAHLTVLLTDAPMDYIESAEVDIGAVILVPADSGGHVVLSDDGTDGPVNLLELQDAATELLAEADIEAGSYSQLRLIVESASVTLAAGYEFTDGTTERDLFVPSGAQTGIKLLLGSADGGDEGEPLVIPPGETMLVVDFDVSQSFVIQGNPETPAGIHGMIFKPTLRVVVADVAGSIAGTVSTDLDSTRVDSLAVMATFAADTATTRTRNDGTYTLSFLAPGSYVVRVTPADTTLDVDPDSAVVVVGASEDVVGVDFELDTIP
jgi:hypothetical protein